MGDVNALELIQLGRQLVKIGEQALRGGQTDSLPNGPRLVLRDVLAHPDTPISAICGRTALPQSYVSESVARLRDQGLVQAHTDASDRRRTLVRISPAHRRVIARKGAASIDNALASALADDGARVQEMIALLEMVAERLAAQPPGPILAQLTREEPSRA